MAFVIITTAFFIVFSGCDITEGAAEDRRAEPPPPRELEILPTRFDAEYDICEARFIITLTYETGQEFLRHTSYTVADFPADFPELRLAGVEEITPGWRRNAVLRWLRRLETGDWDGLRWAQGLSDEEIRTSILSNIMRRYTRRNLILTLEEPSRVNVLQAMRIFEEREDVLYATPDFLPWPGLDPEFERLVKPGLRVGFYHYLGTFNGVVVFARGSGFFASSATLFLGPGYWYEFPFSPNSRMYAWVPCEHNEDGNVFTIGEYTHERPTEIQICWQEILTIDHIRRMYQRRIARETSLWRNGNE